MRSDALEETMMKSKISKTLRRLVPLAAFGVMAIACGGQIPFEAQLNVAGTLPPPPPPPPKPIAKPKPKPVAAPARVEVRDDRIEIHEKIHFESRMAVISDDSFGLMDEISKVLADNPQILKVRIEGHTDSIGTDKYNEELSDKRAKAVLDYIVEHGVDAGRLESKGFGEASPIGDNETDEGREKNRRVEFKILEQKVTETTVEIDDKGNEKVVKKSEKPAEKSDSSASDAEKEN
jgi:OOP family OmpA-OmpF porin